jgi:hypothetical protein
VLHPEDRPRYAFFILIRVSSVDEIYPFRHLTLSEVTSYVLSVSKPGSIYVIYIWGGALEECILHRWTVGIFVTGTTV